MLGRVRLATVVACSFVGAGLLIGGRHSTAATPPAEKASVGQLMGRWVGEGSVVPVSGEAEPFKCVVTYRSASGEATVVQNLRCQSANYKLDAGTELAFAGSRVSGRWEERTNNLSGEVEGVVTAGGFVIFLSGRFFEAEMRVSGDNCAQEVRLTPTKAEHIRELSANLRKC